MPDYLEVLRDLATYGDATHIVVCSETPQIYWKVGMLFSFMLRNDLIVKENNDAISITPYGEYMLEKNDKEVFRLTI